MVAARGCCAEETSPAEPPRTRLPTRSRSAWRSVVARHRCASLCPPAVFPRRHRDVLWRPGTIPAMRREFVASAADRWRRSPRPVLHCSDGGLTAWFIPHCFSDSGGRAEQVRLDRSNTQLHDRGDFRQRQFFGKSQKKDSPLLLRKGIDRSPNRLQLLACQQDPFGGGL